MISRVTAKGGRLNDRGRRWATLIEIIHAITGANIQNCTRDCHNNSPATFGYSRRRAPSNRGPKVRPIPLDKSSDAFSKRRMGCEIDQRLQPMGIGERRRHVTRLHREQIGDGFLAQRPFKRLDKSHEADRLMVADII